MLHIMFAAALAFSASAAAAAGDIPPADRGLSLNVHLYGFSYHTDKNGVRENGLDNQFNIGLGLNYTIKEDAEGIGFAEAGIYKDSGSNLAKVAGMGYQYKLGESWRAGGALLLGHSRTYNHGRLFIAPLPILTYDLGAVKLNAIYVPKFGDYNRFAVFGLYFSVPFGK